MTGSSTPHTQRSVAHAQLQGCVLVANPTIGSMGFISLKSHLLCPQRMLSAGSTDGSQAGGSSTGGSSLVSVRLLSSFGLRPPVALAGLHLGPKLGR